MEKPTFAPQFWQDLARENPLGSCSITERDARDWFDLEWPGIREFYVAKHPRSKPYWRRRLVRCWSKLKEDDLRRAREYGVASRRSKKGLELEALGKRALTGGFGGLDDDSELPPMRIGERSTRWIL